MRIQFQIKSLFLISILHWTLEREKLLPRLFLTHCDCFLIFELLHLISQSSHAEEYTKSDSTHLKIQLGGVQLMTNSAVVGQTKEIPKQRGNGRTGIIRPQFVYK